MLLDIKEDTYSWKVPQIKDPSLRHVKMTWVLVMCKKVSYGNVMMLVFSSGALIWWSLIDFNKLKFEEKFALISYRLPTFIDVAILQWFIIMTKSFSLSQMQVHKMHMHDRIQNTQVYSMHFFLSRLCIDETSPIKNCRSCQNSFPQIGVCYIRGSYFIHLRLQELQIKVLHLLMLILSGCYENLCKNWFCNSHWKWGPA